MYLQKNYVDVLPVQREQNRQKSEAHSSNSLRTRHGCHRNKVGTALHTKTPQNLSRLQDSYIILAPQPMSHPSQDISQNIGQDVGQGETFHPGWMAHPSTSMPQSEALSRGLWSGSFGALPSEPLFPKLFPQRPQPALSIKENAATQGIFRNRDRCLVIK